MYKKLAKTFEKAEQEHDRMEKSIARREAKLKTERENLKFPSWIQMLVRPIGKALVSKMPGYTMEILGPFGINCNIAIHFTPEKKSRLKFKSINFTFSDRLYWQDTSKKTGKYPPNTLGDLNGMNYPEIEIPENADLDWFLKRVK